MKKISLSVILSFFTLFVNGYAEENTPPSEWASALSRHFPYISYDISREEAGIGYRYQRNVFMYDFHGSYKCIANGYYKPFSKVSFSPAFHCIVSETPLCLTYMGCGFKVDLFFTENISLPRKDRMAFSPILTIGHLFKKEGCPSPFAEIYYLPYTLWNDGKQNLHQIGLKMGIAY